MTINVVEVLQKQIELLMKVETVKEGDDVSNYLEALDTIMDFIDNIDIANGTKGDICCSNFDIIFVRL